MILHLWMGFAAVLAVIYGGHHCWRNGASWQRSAIKTGAMAGLALAAAALGAPVWVVLGLDLGAFWLSLPGNPTFLVGMFAFALGYLAYAVYFVGLADAPPFGLLTALVLILLAATTESYGLRRTPACCAGPCAAMWV